MYVWLKSEYVVIPLKSLEAPKFYDCQSWASMATMFLTWKFRTLIQLYIVMHKVEMLLLVLVCLIIISAGMLNQYNQSQFLINQLLNQR